MDIEDVLDEFTYGDFSRWLNYFGDYQTFFKFLDRRGLLAGNVDPSDNIDPRDDQSGDWANDLMLYLHKHHPEKYKEYLDLMLGDVRYVNGRPYIICNKEDLSELFCKNRREGLDQDTIGEILSGGGDLWDRYWNAADNVYRDVIEELTPANLKTLSEYIVENFKGEKLFPETELLESIAVEQGHPGYFEFTNENIMRIIKDSDSMKELLGDQLNEIKSTLNSIYDNAYNSAYESMIYKNIESELETYFDMENGKWDNIPHPFKKDTFVERWTAPIQNFDSNILQYLEDNRNYGSNGTLEYHGEYLGVLKAYIDDTGGCLNADVDDYPDFREVDKLINEFFKDEF